MANYVEHSKRLASPCLITLFGLALWQNSMTSTSSVATGISIAFLASADSRGKETNPTICRVLLDDERAANHADTREEVTIFHRSERPSSQCRREVLQKTSKKQDSN